MEDKREMQAKRSTRRRNHKEVQLPNNQLSRSSNMASPPIAAFHTPRGDVAEIFKQLGVSLGASLESRLSPSLEEFWGLKWAS